MLSKYFVLMLFFLPSTYASFKPFSLSACYFFFAAGCAVEGGTTTNKEYRKSRSKAWPGKKPKTTYNGWKDSFHKKDSFATTEWFLSIMYAEQLWKISILSSIFFEPAEQLPQNPLPLLRQWLQTLSLLPKTPVRIVESGIPGRKQRLEV